MLVCGWTFSLLMKLPRYIITHTLPTILKQTRLYLCILQICATTCPFPMWDQAFQSGIFEKLRTGLSLHFHPYSLDIFWVKSLFCFKFKQILKKKMNFLSPNPGIGNWVQSQDPSGAWSWVNMETIMTGRQPSIVSRWRQVGGWVREQIGCLRPLHHCYLELFTSTTLLPTWYTRTMAKGVDSFAWWTPYAKGLKWDHVETLMMWLQLMIVPTQY